jgi:general secretion pathway protein A
MNVICDRALLGAYSRESRRVNKWMVRRAAAEVSGQSLTPVAFKWAIPVVAAIGAALALVGLWSLIEQDESVSAETVRIPVTAGGSAAQVAAIDADDAPAEDGARAVNSMTIEDQLRAAGPDTSVETAMRTLFRLWNVDYEHTPGSSACQVAETKGLSCFFNRGSWSGIRQLDRPVMLTLTDSRGDTHQPVLVSMTDDTGELAIADTRVTYPLDDISDMWFGQYLLVWRPPNGRNDVIRPGMRDPNVLWLRQSLAAIDSDFRPQNLNSELFDDELQQKLMEFQRAHRLRIDGIAGEQTQILINSLLGPGGSPQLVAQSR